MLAEAKELQQNAVKQLVEQLEYKDEIVFKAPTGSGKTYMMADFMNRILEGDKNVVFLVSSLSKGDLARQNYDKFCEYQSKMAFPYLSPYLISSEISGEERLFIPTDYNVYILPRDLYKAGGRLMQGAMEAFLQYITLDERFGGGGKTVYLIKDECHIATNNLDTLSKKFFNKVINFSATPNLKRGQNPDVEIRDEEAVNAKLIKHIIWGEDEQTVADAITKFEQIKQDYRNLLGVNPCLIIQISNKGKEDDELNNVIFPELNKAEHQDLKWMLIVNDEKSCKTNDPLKVKKIPVSRWKDYAKENTATIDVIIFKMVISEGWDIPRACMLYQVRDSKSKQLDEQVMGRVRRNPRLLDFETLSEGAKKLATTAWVWGVKPKGEDKKIFPVKLWDEPSDITSNIRLKTTRLKSLQQKDGFNVGEYLAAQPEYSNYDSIFELHRKLTKAGSDIDRLCYSYADTIDKWFDFAGHIDGIVKEHNSYLCSYNDSMELVSDEAGNAAEYSFPSESIYVDNGNYINIADWVWRRKDGNKKFSFDSEAEMSWASMLKDVVALDTSESTPKRVGMQVRVGKANPKAGIEDLFGNVEPDKISSSIKYLWGKNYLSNSEIKYEYCLGGVHSSYPDFIMKDSFGRIHIFEVKSVNPSNNTSSSFDSDEYKTKVEELKRCYKQASILTGHIFYLPVLKGDVWHITRLMDGRADSLTEEQFVKFVCSDN